MHQPPEISIMRGLVTMQHFMVYYEFYCFSRNILAVQYRIDMEWASL